jgi:hypothetical protein
MLIEHLWNSKIDFWLNFFSKLISVLVLYNSSSTATFLFCEKNIIKNSISICQNCHFSSHRMKCNMLVRKSVTQIQRLQNQNRVCMQWHPPLIFSFEVGLWSPVQKMIFVTNSFTSTRGKSVPKQSIDSYPKNSWNTDQWKKTPLTCNLQKQTLNPH